MKRRAAVVACRALLLPILGSCGIAVIAFGQEGSPPPRAFSKPETPAPGLFQSATPSEADAAAAALPVPPPPAAPRPQPQPHESAAPKRSLFGRILHPFSGGGGPAPPDFKDPRLRGLALDLQLSPQPVKLSEVRQLEVKLTMTNKGKRGINLDFPNEQRVEIYLLNSADVILTKWSDNHAFKDKPGTLLINPQEHVEYNERISTRELAPDKVYIAEAFLPKYPELRVRQKFLTSQ
jgi:hypothetical protein